jgi:tRNA(Arg) A34 adenosine deaminase TadA
MSGSFTSIDFTLPAWLDHFVSCRETCGSGEKARMEVAIELARRNVEEDLGGPVGAAIFESKTGRLVAAGVNRAMDQNCSVLHAEIVAIMLAQRVWDNYTLSAPNMPALELVSSCEPCGMCLGAICWSGLTRVICGAREEDAVAIGFDEGPKPDRWVEALRSRGIEVTRDVLRQEARGVLEFYVERGGEIYNGRSIRREDP